VPDSSSILGGALFLGASGALVYGGVVAGVVYEAIRPQRRTIGWALARGLPSEPTAWGLEAREWMFEHDGARCPVWEIGSADPSARTCVVLHGFSRSRYDALARLGPLLPHAQRFLLPDLPGHGEATGRGTRLGTDEDAFLAALCERQTAGELVFVGHSLGATIAIHAATQASLASRMQGVLALAPYERLRTPLAARLELRAMPRDAIVAPSIAALGALGIRERSTRAAAACMRCPLAVLAGAQDPVTPVAEARAIAEAAPNARFELVERARHDDFDSLGRDAIAAAMAWITHRAAV